MPCFVVLQVILLQVTPVVLGKVGGGQGLKGEGEDSAVGNSNSYIDMVQYRS